MDDKQASYLQNVKEVDQENQERTLRIQELKAELDTHNNVPDNLLRELQVLEVQTERLKVAGENLGSSLQIRERILGLLGEVEDPHEEARRLLALQRLYAAPGEESMRALEMELELLKDEHYSYMYDAQKLPRKHEEAYAAYATDFAERPLIQKFLSMRGLRS